MEKNESREKSLREIVREESRDGRLVCSRALALAEKLGVSPADVGRAADEAGVKIAACQLGCFK